MITNVDFFLIVIVYLNVFANIGIMLFFQHGRLEVLEGYLQGTQWVEHNRAVWGGGYIGRQMRLNVISIIVFFPGMLHKRGHIEKDADKKIPKKLRKQLSAAYLHLVAAVLFMAVLHFTVVAKHSA